MELYMLNLEPETDPILAGAWVAGRGGHTAAADRALAGVPHQSRLFRRSSRCQPGAGRVCERGAAGLLLAVCQLQGCLLPHAALPHQVCVRQGCSIQNC